MQPAFSSMPAGTAPAPPSSLSLQSWLSYISSPPVYLPLLRLSAGVALGGAALYLAYRAGQRSQQRPQAPQRREGASGYELKEREEKKEEERINNDEPRRRVPLSVQWSDVLLLSTSPSSLSSSDAISPTVRRALRRTCIYILSGLGITASTIAFLLRADNQQSAFLSPAALSSFRSRLLVFLLTAASAVGVQLLSKRRWQLKHLAFVLFHVGSGCMLAPLFLLPSAITLKAAAVTGTLIASTCALALSASTRSSLWLYSPLALGSSLLIGTALTDLLSFLSGRGRSPRGSVGLTARDSLALVGGGLLFVGYLVLDLQKLILVSEQMERDRRSRAAEMPDDDDGDVHDDDDDDGSGPRRPPFSFPPPRPPHDDRRRPPQQPSPFDAQKGAATAQRSNVSSSSFSSSSSPSAARRREHWLTSDAWPDYAALSLDLYLDAVNIFVRAVEWYSRLQADVQQQQQEEEEEREEQGGRRRRRQ